MSGSQQKPFPCPNCQTPVDGNYCSQCGQPARLHDGSFWSMILHFFAHYLHYESKFLQTLKTLVFRPGRASIDFREKKRARHVEPMSLYIFVVITYFIISGLLTSLYHKLDIGAYSQAAIEQERAETEQSKIEAGESGFFRRVLGAKAYERFDRFRNADRTAIEEKLNPMGPKIFFFMVPLFALLMSIFYLFKKDYTFIEHTVFSIHVHTFWFILELCIELLGAFEPGFLDYIGLAVLAIYTIIAQVRFYRTNWVYASIAFGISFCVYMFCFIVILILIILLFL